ncbi:MAG TPA: hypothetical protein VKD72_18735, partial [Gemmataceae bacterium]|nr:hypothetical protein [Gemmataceae bacterium]
YWDPEYGVKLDATIAGGVPVLGQREETLQGLAQVSCVQSLPEELGWLGRTRLAFRLYGAAGLPDRGQLFSLGGNLLFRGFDLRERQGSDVWVASAEWRLPILEGLDCSCCDHAVGLHGVELAPFYDAGAAYLERHPLGTVAHAVGCGLRLDVSWLGFLERTTLRFDFARTVNAPTPVQFWFGIQQPF